MQLYTTSFAFLNKHFHDPFCLGCPEEEIMSLLQHMLEIIILLHLSSAFDTVDCFIQLVCLHRRLPCAALNWLKYNHIQLIFMRHNFSYCARRRLFYCGPSELCWPPGLRPRSPVVLWCHWDIIMRNNSIRYHLLKTIQRNKKSNLPFESPKVHPDRGAQPSVTNPGVILDGGLLI